MTAETASNGEPTVEKVTAEEASGYLRMAEALLFAATEPLDEASLSARLPELLAELVAVYENRGVNLVRVAGKWALRTAPDLHFLLQEHRQQTRKLSRAALEILAITAYHQPVTRAEIEDVRGVSLSKGTLDLLIKLGWVRIRGRRRTPGRPVTYGTTEGFLEHFGFQSAKDLPGLDELKASGLLEGQASFAPVAPGARRPAGRGRRRQHGHFTRTRLCS